jgi:hypothetical protein
MCGWPSNCAARQKINLIYKKMKKNKNNDRMESKLSFKEVLEQNFPARKTEKTKYLISKSKIKDGFSSDKFIIFGENKREFDRYRNSIIDQLDPKTVVQVDLVFMIIKHGWDLKRINLMRNGLMNAETRILLEKAFNIVDTQILNKEEIEKELTDLDKKSEVMGMIYARDCIGVNAFEKLSRLETSIHAKYIKIYDYYKLDRFGKELYEQRQVSND